MTDKKTKYIFIGNPCVYSYFHSDRERCRMTKTKKPLLRRDIFKDDFDVFIFSIIVFFLLGFFSGFMTAIFWWLV